MIIVLFIFFRLNDDDNTRFPRMEEMSHFHYSSVDFGGAVKVSNGSSANFASTIKHILAN